MAFTGREVSAVRPLGAVEHLFSLLDGKRPTHFVMAFEVSGRTTPAEWRAGLRAVQGRHPLLSCFIGVGEDGRPAFFHSAGAAIPLRETEGAALSAWEREMEDELALPFNSAHAPLLRAVLMHEPERAVLLFSSHHSLADANWTCLLMRDLLQAVSGQAVVPLPLLPSQETLVAGLPPNDEGSAGPQEEAAPGGEAAVYVEAGLKPRVDRLELSPAFTAALRDRARAEGTTMHRALCAAAALAGKRASPHWRANTVRLLSPASTRKLLGVEGDCGLFLNPGMVSVGVDAPASVWELARFLNEPMAGVQTRRALEATTATLGGLLRGLPDVETVASIAAQAFGREMMVSNLGALAIPSDYRALRLEAAWGPATLEGFKGEQTLGAATTNGALRLLLTSHTPPPLLLRHLEELLRAACEGV